MSACHELCSSDSGVKRSALSSQHYLSDIPLLFSFCVFLFYLFFYPLFLSCHSFLFLFSGEVQCVAQENQPHLGLCGHASQRATQVHTHTHTHTHTHLHSHLHSHAPLHTKSHTNLLGDLCFRASKQRRKADRIVLECQEQAYWLINRPPVRSLLLLCSTVMNQTVCYTT